MNRLSIQLERISKWRGLASTVFEYPADRVLVSCERKITVDFFVVDD